jgi:hypothetical protein
MHYVMKSQNVQLFNSEVSFTGAFAKLRKATVNFVMSVRPSS